MRLPSQDLAEILSGNLTYEIQLAVEWRLARLPYHIRELAVHER
jgi:hypothetical protein